MNEHMRINRLILMKKINRTPEELEKKLSSKWQ